MSKVIVIGGRGYIGSVLVSKLVDRGHRVFVIDDLSSPAINLNKPKEHQFSKSIDWNEVVDFKPDVIFNLAADLVVGRCEESWQHTVQKNILPILDTVWFPCRQVIASTIAHNEESNYGRSKKLLEMVCSDETFVRPCNVIGVYEGILPNPKTRHILEAITKQWLFGDDIKLYGGGDDERDFIYVGDVADVFIYAWEHMVEGEIIEAGTGERTSMLAFMKLIDSIKPVQYYVVDDRRAGDPTIISTDNPPFERIEGNPRPLFEVLEEWCTFIEANKDQLKGYYACE